MWNTAYNGCRTVTSLSAHRILAKIDHMLSHGGSLNKCQRINMIQSMSSVHNGIKPEISSK